MINAEQKKLLDELKDWRCFEVNANKICDWMAKQDS